MAEAGLTHEQTADWYEIPLVLGFDTQSEVPNVLHRIIGRGAPDVTIKDAAPWTGTFDFWFEDGGTAFNVFETHRHPGTLLLYLYDGPKLIRYVVNGALSMRQEPGTQRWVVSVPYAEVYTR